MSEKNNKRYDHASLVAQILQREIGFESMRMAGKEPPSHADIAPIVTGEEQLANEFDADGVPHPKTEASPPAPRTSAQKQEARFSHDPSRQT